MKNINLSVDQRVELGVAFVKGIYGKDALSKIKLQKLAMERADSCMLGQLGGDYDAELERLGLTEDDAYNFGFFAENDEPDRYDASLWTSLTKAWRRFIRNNR